MMFDDTSAGTTIDTQAMEEEFPRNRDNRPRRLIQHFPCYKEGHRYADCPYKDITDLKFCTHCGVGDHSLEDCPTMLEKIETKKTLMYFPLCKKMM